MSGVGECCYAVAAFILIIVNLLLMVFGFVLTVIGGILMWGRSVVAQYVHPFLTKTLVTENVSEDVGDASGIAEEILGIVNPLGLAFFICGFILMAVSFSAVLGACSRNKILLGIYAIFAAFILVSEFAFLILLMTKREEFIDGKGRQVKYSIKTEFMGTGNKNFHTFLVNAVQVEFQCCGVQNGSDFSNAMKWDRTFTTEDNETKILQYPLSCCRRKDYKIVDMNCTTTPTVKNSNHAMGCLTEVKDWLTSYTQLIVGVFFMLIFLQCLLLTCVLLLFYQVIVAGPTKVEPAKQ